MGARDAEQSLSHRRGAHEVQTLGNLTLVCNSILCEGSVTEGQQL